MGLISLILGLITGAMVLISSCSSINQSSTATIPIEGPSNLESQEEAKQVEQVLNSAGRQAIPAAWDGCWTAEISSVDSFKQLVSLPAGSLITIECCATVQYQMCFDHSSGGVYFSASNLGWKLNSDWLFVNQLAEKGTTTVSYSEAKEFMVLRSTEAFSSRGNLLALPAMSLRISSRSDLQASSRDPDRIFVEGSTEDVCEEPKLIGCLGKPWVSSTWHGDFVRIRQTSRSKLNN
jgi:hypothetical protein